MGNIWQTVMHDNYIRAVKNLAEEGMELLAYSLVLFTAGGEETCQSCSKKPSNRFNNTP
ncbi:hypothetical protein [uncultured Photobacterium sp.]|uniref:hypothetical protein n=1 Tax=uncultured Photobacterium sp. TaxID=173973 RepID=UPI00262327F3|nr:hypothetical protein [uncultured Photobacterium sp.]